MKKPERRNSKANEHPILTKFSFRRDWVMAAHQSVRACRRSRQLAGALRQPRVNATARRAAQLMFAVVRLLNSPESWSPLTVPSINSAAKLECWRRAIIRFVRFCPSSMRLRLTAKRLFASVTDLLR